MADGVCYLVAGKRGRWTIWKEGDSRPVQQLRKKEQAIIAARALAREVSGEVAVYTQNGLLRSQHRHRR